MTIFWRAKTEQGPERKKIDCAILKQSYTVLNPLSSTELVMGKHVQVTADSQ